MLADPRLRDSLGRAAHARACEFTWDATARRTLQLLDAQRRARSDPTHPAAPAAGVEPLRPASPDPAALPVAGDAMSA